MFIHREIEEYCDICLRYWAYLPRKISKNDWQTAQFTKFNQPQIWLRQNTTYVYSYHCQRTRHVNECMSKTLVVSDGAVAPISVTPAITDTLCSFSIIRSSPLSTWQFLFVSHWPTARFSPQIFEAFSWEEWLTLLVAFGYRFRDYALFGSIFEARLILLIWKDFLILLNALVWRNKEKKRRNNASLKASLVRTYGM